MKPTHKLRTLLLGSTSLLALASLPAATFYWDNNGTTSGFGNAGGTWAQNNTSGGTSARWKTDVNGTAAGSNTQATTNSDIFNFGTNTLGLGSGTITVSGTVTMGDTFYGAASGNVVLSGGTINFGDAKTITVNNTTNTISSILGGAATSLTKAGSGALVLTGASTYTGTTIINGGTINLGNAGATGSLASSSLILGGGALNFSRSGTNTQSFASGTTINTGASTVLTNNGANTINLGALTRTVAGGVLSISPTGTITTTTGNSNGMLGGWAVINNAGAVTNWAFSTGSGLDITGGVTYDQTSTLLDSASAYADKNIDVTSSQAPDAAISPNSLRFHAGSAQTLTLQGANTIVSGGILVSNTAGNIPTITGGTLAGSASGDLIVHQYQTTNGLTIDSQIVNNGGATALTKSGPGLLTLNASNTFTGGVFLHGGKIVLGNAGAINSGTPNNVTFGAGSSGILSLNGNNLTIPVLISNDTAPGAAVIENANAANVTLTISSASSSSFGGVLQDGTGGGTLALTKAGSGTLTLSSPNTYTGGTTLSSGTIAISNATALGAGAVSVTGNSRINAAALTYANDISIDAGRVLTLGATGAASSTSTFSGAITGDGGITLAQGVNSGSVINLSSTSNTFTGNITLPTASGTNDFINFASVGDGGSIIFGRASWLANVRYTGAANLVFNSRNIALATTFGIATGLDGGGNPSHMFENNGSGTVTFNTAMGVTSTATSGFFFLGGSNTGSNTFAGAIADPSGANTLGIGKAGTGKWILSNNTNSYEGNVLLHGGTLSVGMIDVAANAQPLGKGSFIQLGYRNANVGTLEYTGSANAVTDKQIQLGQLSNSTNGNFTGGGVILSNGTGTLTFSNATFNSTTGVPVSGTGIDRTLTLGGTNTGANAISGTIQDNNTAIGAQLILAKTGTGTWVLSGANTYTGGTNVSGGALVFRNTSAKPSTGTHAFAAGTTLGLGVGGSGFFSATDVTNAFAGTMTGNLSGITVTATTNIGIDTSAGDFAYNDSITGSPSKGLVKLGTGILTLGGTNTYAGGTTILAGTVVAGSTDALGDGNVTVGASGTLDLGGNAVTNTITNNGGTILGASNAAINQTDGSLTGTVATGSTLSGSIAGTFSPSGTISGAFTSTGKLMGTATFTGAVTIQGTHAPGNSPGIETFAAGITYNATSVLEWDFEGNTLLTRGTHFDGVDVTGGNLVIVPGATLKLIADLAVDYTDPAWDTLRVFSVVDNSGAGITSGDFILDLTAAGNPIGQGSWSVLTASGAGGDTLLTWTPVPEPSTYAALAGLAVLGLAWNRRRQRQVSLS